MVFIEVGAVNFFYMQELHEINRWCSPASLLVIKKNGELIRLFCPFNVVVIYPIEELKKGSMQIVVQVKMDKQYTPVYVIGNKGYYYWNFSICI